MYLVLNIMHMLNFLDTFSVGVTSDKVSENIVEKDTPHALEIGKTLGGNKGVHEHPQNENFQDPIKALEKIKVNMPIKEMVEKTPCSRKFLQEIVKLDEETSTEGCISLSKNCCVVQDFQVPKEEGDPRCFNVPVTVGTAFVGEALCDLGVNVNLMSLAPFNHIRGLTLRPCFLNVSLAYGRETKPVGIVRDVVIDINGFQFEINIIAAHDTRKQDYPLVLGRCF